MDIWDQSVTVDPEVRAYVTSLVNALGGRSTYDDSYSIGDDAVAVLKDLLRWLRLYDEKTNRLDVKRCLAEANLVKGDLLEILASWSDDATDNKLKSKLALACLELLVPLTWPMTLEADKSTVNHHRHVPYLQLAQVGYKRAILHHEAAPILRTVVRIGLPAIAQPKRERSRRDEGIAKLVLYFVRNIALITQPQYLPSQGDENEISRSSTIIQFHHQDVFSLLLTIGSSTGDEFPQQDVILLEILFHLLKGVDARKLFITKEQIKSEETNELQDFMRKEKALLNSYKKNAPTRHNRFGTMVWVKRGDEKLSTVSGQTNITDESSTLRQMDSSKKWNKPQYRGKLAQETNELSDLSMRVDLTESTRTHLRQFVNDFLDSSFNPLFASLRKSIERKVDRVLETVHPRQYFFLISWFLTAEAARRDQSRRHSTWNSDRPHPVIAEDNTFAYIAAVLDQETFVLLNRQMQIAFDNAQWQDLQATLLCFTQILLTVQDMADSQDEEDQEIAENIQNRIFYEEATHDRIVQILRGYTHQGFAYLDAVTECVHVFVRMLERYSKQNIGLQIRSKRRARKKRTQEPAASREGEDDDFGDMPLTNGEEEQEAHRALSERKFDFARFSAKFLTQPCVDTFLSFLQYYRDLTSVQLKRCHRFLYRLGFKHDMAIMLFRVDILQLLHRLIKGPEGLDPAAEGFRDWDQLVQQIFRRCTRWLEREIDGQDWRNAAIVEMLFSKMPGTLFYLQNGHEKVVEKRPPRPPAELELKPGVAKNERVGVAVSIMLEQAKGDALGWIKDLLTRAVEERRAWEETQAAILEGGDPVTTAPEILPEAPSIFLTPDNEDRKWSLFKDKHLRLLLATLGFERLGLAEDVDASWIVPSDMSASQLQSAVEQIREAEFNPPTFENYKSALDLVRTKASGRPATASDDSNSDGNSEVDETVFPPNLREKRRNVDDADDEDRVQKRRKRIKQPLELTEEEMAQRADARIRREHEKNAKIKSALFVTESDDESDPEADAEFFRLEAERRRKTDATIRQMLMKQREEPESKNDKRGKTATIMRRHAGHSEPEDEGDLDGDGDMTQGASSNGALSSDSDMESNNTVEQMNDAGRGREMPSPSISLDPDPDAGLLLPRPLKEVSGNTSRRKAKPIVVNEDDDEETYGQDVVSSSRVKRRIRAGFLMDDSDDD